MNSPSANPSPFDDFEHSAWRFEAQPVYTMPNEAENFRLFREGKLEKHFPNRPWHQLVQAKTESGKSIGRVRVVRRPLNEYVKYQFFYGIPNNISVGEDIRILDLTDIELDLPDQDFWFFDDRTVLLLHFRPDGRFIEQEILEDPDLDQYRRWQKIALEHAVPFEDYVRS